MNALRLRWFAVWIGVSHCGVPPFESECGPTSGIVDQVVDGDTVKLKGGQTIRYLLVDTPELHRKSGPECYALAAKHRNEELVASSKIAMQFDDACYDNYHRLLAYVWTNEGFINAKLLREGFARLLIIPPNQRYAEDLAEEETLARQSGAGMWQACP